jgi:hypothetical protein
MDVTAVCGIATICRDTRDLNHVGAFEELNCPDSHTALRFRTDPGVDSLCSTRIQDVVSDELGNV